MLLGQIFIILLTTIGAFIGMLEIFEETLVLSLEVSAVDTFFLKQFIDFPN